MKRFDFFFAIAQNSDMKMTLFYIAPDTLYNFIIQLISSNFLSFQNKC